MAVSLGSQLSKLAAPIYEPFVKCLRLVTNFLRPGPAPKGGNFNGFG